MVTKRIIPCLDVKNGRVVKGKNFLGLNDVDSPVKLAAEYSASGADADIPTAEIAETDLVDGAIDVCALLVKAGLVPSKSEARRAVEQGGVSADGEKVTDTRATFTADVLKAGMVLKRGKKSFKKVVLK